jgi:acyl-CoA thioester hydrolase
VTDPAPAGTPLTHPLRVRYGECDQQKVVFNAHYLAWFDMNMTELWRAAFGSYQAAVDRGLDIVVAAAELRFRASARFDDLVTLSVLVTHLGTTSVITHHGVWREGELLVEGSLRHVTVDPATLAKAPIPDWFRDGLAPWTVAEDSLSQA